MQRGKFITLEGVEGAGKSTIVKFMQHYFMSHQRDIVMTHEPGGTPLAEKIRGLLLNPEHTETITRDAELLLMFAGRAQHINQCILPALEAGKWVVSDRYIDATYAYQGGGRGIEMSQIEMLDKLIVKDLYPDLTLLLDVPVDVGFKRCELRGGKKDRIESERQTFFIKVRDAYLARAKLAPKRIKVIDASLPLENVQSQISKVLQEFMQQ